MVSYICTLITNEWHFSLTRWTSTFSRLLLGLLLDGHQQIVVVLGRLLLALRRVRRHGATHVDLLLHDVSPIVGAQTFLAVTVLVRTVSLVAYQFMRKGKREDDEKVSSSVAVVASQLRAVLSQLEYAARVKSRR